MTVKTVKNDTKKSDREFVGVVVSSAMKKTIVVKVDRRKMIEKYKKAVRVSRKYHVHDENGAAKVGNQVSFIECRPMSKTKRWNLVKIVK
ncbi:MAG: 30S ribosomal protein S17 [Candidatus Magasanikbacteria bacterium]